MLQCGLMMVCMLIGLQAPDFGPRVWKNGGDVRRWLASLCTHPDPLLTPSGPGKNATPSAASTWHAPLPHPTPLEFACCCFPCIHWHHYAPHACMCCLGPPCHTSAWRMR